MPNKTPAPRKTTTQRGLGHDHQVHRGRLIVRHVDGTRCWWCNRKMFRNPEKNWDGKPLAADHSKPRSIYGTAGNPADRLLHEICNKQRGDGSRDDQRPALNPDAAASLDALDLAEIALLGELVYFAWPT